MKYLEVWGDFACFTRPEMKVERVSYDVMTPSAARGILEAILWKPAIRWHVHRIDVLNPIRWTSVRRNEVGCIFTNPTQGHLNGMSGAPLGFAIEENRQQRAGLVLRDVRYIIHAHFEYIEPERRTNVDTGDLFSNTDLTEIPDDESEAKYAAMFERRAQKGQCFHRPYLGCREFACDFRLLDDLKAAPTPIAEDREFGWMLYDLDYTIPNEPVPMFFRASMQNGVINTDRNEVEVRG